MVWEALDARLRHWIYFTGSGKSLYKGILDVYICSPSLSNCHFINFSYTINLYLALLDLPIQSFSQPVFIGHISFFTIHFGKGSYTEKINVHLNIISFLRNYFISSQVFYDFILCIFLKLFLLIVNLVPSASSLI